MGALALLLVAGMPPPAAAQDEVPVDLELALAVDVSRSIDIGEARLQRQGYVRAFRDPEIARVIRTGMLGRIAVGYFEWAGAGYGRIVVDWRLIDGAAAANALADVLDTGIPLPASRTSLSSALDFAATWFDDNGFDGTRRVIDVSGDGPNNSGELVTVARERALGRGLTINGLPILDESAGPFSRFNIAELDLYYQDCVIGGPGAFIVVAADFRDFARAIRRKLILEIAGQVPGSPAGPRFVPAQASRKDRSRPPCDIGERMWRQRFSPY